MKESGPPEIVTPNEKEAGPSAPSPDEYSQVARPPKQQLGMSTVYGLPPPPISNQIPDVAPPSYDSIFGKVKKIQKESANVGDKVYDKCCSIVCCTIFSGICLAVPVFLLVYGVMYLNSCPARPLIPLYLVVSGSLAVVHILLLIVRTIWVHIKKKRLKSANTTNPDIPSEPSVSAEAADKETEVQLPRAFKVLEGLLVLVSVIWFFIGNGVTYSLWREKPPVTIRRLPLTFCDPEIFLTAFWFINSIYILAGSSCFCMCFIGCCASVK